MNKPSVGLKVDFVFDNWTQLSLNGSGAGPAVPTSGFLGKKVIMNNSSSSRFNQRGSFKIVAEDAKQETSDSKQTDKDRWKGLAYDISDDQQDITRGKGMVDSLFQAPMASGTHYAVMSSYEYISTGLRQ